MSRKKIILFLILIGMGIYFLIGITGLMIFVAINVIIVVGIVAVRANPNIGGYDGGHGAGGHDNDDDDDKLDEEDHGTR
jgi:hypothetical protein